MQRIVGTIKRQVTGTPGRIWLITTVACVISIVVVWSWVYLFTLPPANRSITGVPVTAVFVDINNDGSQDLLVYGEVIYSTTPLAVTQ